MFCVLFLKKFENSWCENMRIMTEIKLVQGEPVLQTCFTAKKFISDYPALKLKQASFRGSHGGKINKKPE